ncbi:MAG: substrate-binding domain-containing protein [Deltaproteobacteria bacterium]|jgi:simple sugar transport system substrate-binding protein|nr:MAG: substrate-binding domain-containing protein [Deltaproteobacteria bacterium]
MRHPAAMLALIGLAALGPSPTARAQESLGKGINIYFQMGGNPGDGSTLPRTNGARAAAAAFGVKLVEQYSGWQPEVMLQHFREALAASPACIEIMGHPGNEAFAPLVADAVKRGIVVTSGNSPLTKLQGMYGANGFGYAGVDLYEGGKLTAQKMMEYGGLKSGDKALEYGLRAQAERGRSDQGLYDTLKAAGLEVDYIEISPEVDHDSSQAVPILTAYLQKHPDVKAIGTQHGNVTAFIGKALEQAGKKPGAVTAGGIDLAPATIEGLKKGYVSVVLDQQLYLQGFLPVVQCVLSKKYGFAGLSTNTGAGVVTPKTIGGLTPLIEKGIR